MRPLGVFDSRRLTRHSASHGNEEGRRESDLSAVELCGWPLSRRSGARVRVLSLGTEIGTAEAPERERV